MIQEQMVKFILKFKKTSSNKSVLHVFISVRKLQYNLSANKLFRFPLVKNRPSNIYVSHF